MGSKGFRKSVPRKTFEVTGNSKTYKGTFSNYPHFSGSKKKNLKLEKYVVKRVQAVVHGKVERLLGRPLSSPDIGDVVLPSDLPSAAASAVRTPEFEPPPLSQGHHHFTDDADEGDETMNLRIRSDGAKSASHQYDDVHGEDHRTCDFEEAHK